VRRIATFAFAIAETPFLDLHISPRQQAFARLPSFCYKHLYL
jgi:hypothetical protein